MDRETYNASIEDEILNTDDISRLNDIIGDDDWNTSISHLALHRILHLAGVDNVLGMISETEYNTEGDLAPESRVENDHSGYIIQEELPIVDEGPMEYMTGGDNPLPADENVSKLGLCRVSSSLLLQNIQIILA